MTETLVSLNEWDWSDDYSFMRELTCVNHRGMRYLTKNPWLRGLHIVARDASLVGTGQMECDCKFGDLRVIAEKSVSDK